MIFSADAVTEYSHFLKIIEGSPLCYFTLQ